MSRRVKGPTSAATSRLTVDQALHVGDETLVSPWRQRECEVSASGRSSRPTERPRGGDASGGDGIDDTRKEHVFHAKHACRETVGVVARKHRDRPLRDDRSAVELLADLMNGDAAHA